MWCLLQKRFLEVAANGCEIGYLVTVEPVDMDLQQAKATTEEVRGELSVV